MNCCCPFNKQQMKNTTNVALFLELPVLISPSLPLLLLLPTEFTIELSVIGDCVIVESGKVWLEGEYDNIKYMFIKHFHGVGSVGLSFHKVSEMEFKKWNYSGKFKMTVVDFKAEGM